jgi:hypothetical protein
MTPTRRSAGPDESTMFGFYARPANGGPVFLFEDGIVTTLANASGHAGR